jgi:hypothetical protein
MKNLTEQAKEVKLMLSTFGTGAATAMLKNIPGIILPDDFNTLPEEEQTRRIQAACQIAIEEDKPTGKPREVYTTLDQVYQDAQPHQVTVQELINERTHLCGQWQSITLSDDLREQIIKQVAQTSGGRHTTRARVYGALKYGRPQHWALSRFLLVKYSNPARFSYCAGQDMTYEMKALRNSLK